MFYNRKSKFKIGEIVKVINPKEMYTESGRQVIKISTQEKIIVGKVLKISNPYNTFKYQIQNEIFMYDEKNLISLDLKTKIKKLLTI